MNQSNQTVWIEIDICQRREDGFDCEGVDLGISCAKLGCPMRVHRDALDHMNQEILKSCRCIVFAADTKNLASFAF